MLEECKRSIGEFNQNLNALEVKLHNQNILSPKIIQHVGNLLDYRTQVQLSRTCHFFNLHMKSALDKSRQEQVNFVSGAVGASHTVLLKGDGTAWGCGSNEQGQLGLGDQKKAPSLQRIPGLPKIKQVVAKEDATLFLGEDGTVWSCGHNISSQLGFKVDHSTPIQVTCLRKIKSIATGPCRTIFITEDGSAICCVDLSERGLRVSMKYPGSEFIDIKQAAVGGEHILFLDENGKVWGCGSNIRSQLGLDSRIKEQKTPVKIKGLNNIKQISAGEFHSLFLGNDGTVKGCGSNFRGQLGFSSENENLPLVTLNISDIRQILALSSSSIIVKKNRTVWACGANYSNQLGFVFTGIKYKFTQILELANINYVVSGADSDYATNGHTLFFGEGVIYGCGVNFDNQLGYNERKILKPTSLFQFSPQNTQETNETKISGPK